MKLKKLITIVVVFRVIIIVASTFLPVVGPHEWRQFDTIGLSLRYFINIFQSASTEYPFILPAILQAGDTTGVIPTEFPLLYLLLSPFFFLGPFWGKALISISLLLLNIFILFWNLKNSEDQVFFEKKISSSLLLLPIFSFSLTFFGKFMPDMLSVLLVLTSINIWGKNKRSILLPFCVCSLGLMLKPTSVIALALMLGNGSYKNMKAYVWVSLSISLTLIYFKIINPLILEFSGNVSLFAVNLKSFSESILALRTEYHQFVVTVLQKLMGNFIFWFYLIFLILLAKRLDFRWHVKILGIIVLQISFLSLITGSHAFVHNYYYLGVTPLVCFLMFDLLNHLFESDFSFGKIKVKILFSLLILGTVIDQSYKDIRPILNPTRKAAWGYYKQCKELKENASDYPWRRGYHFRSPDQMYPELGVCFGEIQNSKVSAFGFFPKSATLPLGCIKTHESKDLYLVQCS